MTPREERQVNALIKGLSAIPETLPIEEQILKFRKLLRVVFGGDNEIEQQTKSDELTLEQKGNEKRR